MGDEKAVDRFSEGIDEKDVQQAIWKDLNNMFSQLSHLVHYKHHLLLYKIVKRKLMKPDDLAELAGYTKSRLYKIVQDFESKEIERQANRE